MSEHGTTNGRSFDDKEARRRLMELGGDPGPGPTPDDRPFTDDHRVGRRRRNEDGHEIPIAAAELADPEQARRHAPRLGAALWNVACPPLFGEHGSVDRLYRALVGIRVGAVKIQRQYELGDVLGDVAAAPDETDEEIAKGEAAGAKADLLEVEADGLAMRAADLELRKNDGEKELERAYEERARARDGRAERPEPQELVPPTGQAMLARVTTAIGEHVRLLFAIDLLAVTILLFTALSATLPSTVPFGLDVLVASTAIGAGLLCAGAVAGYGVAAAEPSPRLAAALFALAGIAVIALGLYKLEAAYGSTLAAEARSVLVVGTIGAVLLAAFTAYCDLLYRAAELRRTVLEGAGSLLGDAAERIARVQAMLALVVAELADVKALQATKLAEAAELRDVERGTPERVAARNAKLRRDEVMAGTIEAVAASGVAQEGHHGAALVAAAKLGWLKSTAEPDEPKDGALAGTASPRPAALVSAGLLLLAAAGVLVLSAVATILTGFVWLLVGGALLAALLVVAALVLRGRGAHGRVTPIQGIPEGSVAPSSGLRRWLWHPDHLVPGYDRGPNSSSTDH